MVSIPEGFTPHEGGAMPVGPEDYVEVLVMTDEGLGSSGVCRARQHEWEVSKHEDGIGAIVAYRLADGPHEEAAIGIYKRERVTKAAKDAWLKKAKTPAAG